MLNLSLFIGLITHLEPDILEGEVKWALESITTNKASGGDGSASWETYMQVRKQLDMEQQTGSK